MGSVEKTTLSFYRYVRIEDPELLMKDLRTRWEALGVLGRTYLATEGVNAQVSVPNENLDAFREDVYKTFPDIPFKLALEDASEAFEKLKIKVRTKIVADGLPQDSFDAGNVGRHLDAQAFHAAMDLPGTLVVDMRNHYECEVGRFEGAVVPDANTFREALPEVLERLQGQEDKKILLYCTGGIRCEKASAWLKFHGFKDVNQLHGGIIDYARQVKEQKLPYRFLGKNFVFDKRMGERVTHDVISHCHQCDALCDEHTNCSFEGCNRLFIQCPRCAVEFTGCCSLICLDALAQPKEERIRIQREWEEQGGPKHYWSRTRLSKDQIRSRAENAGSLPFTHPT